MSVFKGYFKVLRANRSGMMIYVVIFLALTIIFSFISRPSSRQDFSQTRTPIAVINRDGDSQLVQGLTDYLAKSNRVLDYPDNQEKLQDALFYRNVQYIAIIPAGFTATMLAGGTAALEKVVVPDAMTSQYVDISIDKYLNTVRRYLQFGPPADWAALLANVEVDLAVETPVLMAGKDQAATRSFSYFFTYFAYTQLALVMLGVTSVTLAFNREDVQRRNLCSPLPRRLFNLQLAAGHGLFAIGTWLAFFICGLVFYWQEIISSGLIGLLGLNSLLFTLVCVSIGLLIGSLVKNSNAQIAMVNMVTLGMSFLTGVFMPQAFLSPAVLSLAKFLPSYWYVRANDAISVVDQLSKTSLAPIQTAMLMQLGFAVAILAVTLLLGKERQVA